MSDKIRFPVSDNIWNEWEPQFGVRDHVLVDAEGDPISPADTTNLLEFICHILNRCDIEYDETENQHYIVLDKFTPEDI